MSVPPVSILRLILKYWERTGSSFCNLFPDSVSCVREYFLIYSDEPGRNMVFPAGGTKLSGISGSKVGLPL